jgi:putative membrane protein
MLFVWPINCLTFGLLGFVINVALFFGVGKLGFGFDVATPMAALIGSVAMGLISGVLNFLFKDRNDRDA